MAKVEKKISLKDFGSKPKYSLLKHIWMAVLQIHMQNKIADSN